MTFITYYLRINIVKKGKLECRESILEKDKCPNLKYHSSFIFLLEKPFIKRKIVCFT